MGARISIELQGLLNDPDIKLSFYTEELQAQDENDKDTKVQLVQVKFLVFAADNNSYEERDYVFDVSSHDSRVTLEKDFNFFRNEEQHKELMWSLFAHSVPFTVLPG